MTYWLFLFASSAAAADVTVEINPSTIQLAPTEKTQVLLTLRNGGGQAIAGVTITWPAQAGIEITLSPLTQDQVPAGGAAAWTLQIARDQNAFVPNPVPIRVDYKVGAAGLNGVSTAVLTIQERASKAVTDLADLRVQAPSDLQGGQSAVMYAVVGNKASIPFQITGFAIAVPRFVSPCVVGFACGVAEPMQTSADSQVFDVPIDASLAPQESQIFTVRLTSDRAVQPGSHAIGVRASIAWDEGGTLRLGATTASTQVTVAVLGEKDILTVVGIPTLFLLPGFLVTVTFGLLWKYVRPGFDNPFLDPKTPGFWIVPISLSLVVTPLVYPAFPAGRAIVMGTYSQLNIAFVWFAAIGLGVLAWAIASGSISFAESLVIPKSTDAQIDVLRKLGRSRLSLVRPARQVSFNGAPETAYLLYEDRKRSQVWVSPSITYATNPARAGDLQALIDNALAADDPAKTAESFIKAGSDVRLEWSVEGNTNIKGPTAVPVTKATPAGAGKRIVEAARTS